MLNVSHTQIQQELGGNKLPEIPPPPAENGNKLPPESDRDQRDREPVSRKYRMDYLRRSWRIWRTNRKLTITVTVTTAARVMSIGGYPSNDPH
jgi:hypothetical protein